MPDTQLVEITGRHRLIGELLRDELEVARPERDRGIDLIVYADLSRQVTRFAARPIQMKAATTRAFGINRKYERIAGLILAYVWHLDDPASAVTYALSYPQALGVAEAMGWTETPTWKEKGVYSNTSPGERLVGLLEPYRMSPGRWWQLVNGG